MANINSSPKFSSAKGYNGFDMSQDVAFTSPVGQLIPCYYDILQPGDKINVDSTLISRTMELESSANQEITNVVDYFFVPLEQLNSYFPELFYGVFNPKTSNAVLDQQGQTYFPAITFDFLCSCFFELDNVTQKTDMLRLAASLGIPLDVFEFNRQGNYIAPPNDQWSIRSFSLWLFLAYQKIFNDYYRLDDRTSPVVQSFNTDVFTVAHSNIDEGTVREIFKLHNRPWRKDFFTNVFTSPIAPTDSGMEANTSLMPEMLAQFSHWLTSAGPNAVDSDGSDTTGTPTQVAAYSDTSSIRNAFAMEKYLEITRRAGKDYDSQTLAHFGVKVPRGVSNQVSYLGTHTSDLKIGDVIANATTYKPDGSVGTPIGEIAGKGYAYGKNNNSIKFEAPVHGVFMAIYSGVPKVNYAAKGIDKLNELHSRADFFIPEYDNLGMQPLFMSQVRAFDYLGAGNVGKEYTDLDNIYGWQYRYSQFKTKFDVVKGAFLSTLQSWLPTKNVEAPADADTLAKFYIPSNYLDPMMLVKYNPTNTGIVSIYDTDPLQHYFHFDVKKASKMSTYSLPQL